MKTLLVTLLAFSGLLHAETILDFSSSTEGFASTADPGGSAVLATDIGNGSLRLTNPATWSWRAEATFQKNAAGKPGEIAAALAAAAQSGGFLKFDIILRPVTAATGTTAGFSGVQYLVALNQEIPGGSGGWVQTIAQSLPATAFPPAAEMTIPVSMPLANWSNVAANLRIHPDSSYYKIVLGSNASHATQLEWHIDNLRVEVAAAVPQPITLEAENGALTGVQVATSVSGYQGTGYVTGFDQTGDQVRWIFQAPAALYRLTVRFRTPFGPKGFLGSLNTNGLSGDFPASNTFITYDAGLAETIAGTNTLTLGGGWNFYKIDAVTLTPEIPQPPPSPGPAIPADPNATPQARALLALIVSQYGKQTLSGQHGSADLATIQATSGKLPAIFEGDLIEYSPTRVAHAGLPSGYTESLISQAQAGHVLSVMWHWNAPDQLLETTEQPWWTGFYTAGTTFDVAAALADPNSPSYGQLLRDIDAIAVQLQKINAANVPILWRPLHESEGGWFWWGAKGPAAFKQLWRLLYDRLTNYHQLHNLIWVLTSEDAGWYPGNDVVDIVGVDAYPDDHGDALFPRWQPLRDRFAGVKPIALTEFGGVPDIEKMQRLGVWWAWFSSWQGNLGPSSEPPATVARIYQSATVVTLEELPSLAASDTNRDGVTDREAITLGLDPAFDLQPTIEFFRTNSERFGIGHTAADLVAARQEVIDHPGNFDLYTASQLQSLALGRPVLQRDPTNGDFTLKLSIAHSPDLTHWSPIVPAAAVLQPDGSLLLHIPPDGPTQFYQLQGDSP